MGIDMGNRLSTYCMTTLSHKPNASVSSLLHTIPTYDYIMEQND